MCHNVITYWLRKRADNLPTLRATASVSQDMDGPTAFPIMQPYCRTAAEVFGVCMHKTTAVLYPGLHLHWQCVVSHAERAAFYLDCSTYYSYSHRR
jgi:hypothetical protein